MNNWGIGLSVVALLLGGLAAYLGAEVYDARSKRLVKLDTVRAEVAELELELLNSELAVDSRREQYISEQQIWGRVWDNAVDTRVTRDEIGLIELGVGKSNGLAAIEDREGAPLPSVHVFGVDGPEQSVYLGEFQLNGVDDTFATAQLRYAPLEGETANWTTQTYRVRSTAPPQYGSIIRDIVTEHQIATQALVAERTALAEVERQATQAQELIDTRLAQLNGDPNVDGPEIVKTGLIAATAEQNIRADAAATKIAALRQRYFAKFQEFETLLGQITTLYSRLPGASETNLQLGVTALPAAVK